MEEKDQQPKLPTWPSFVEQDENGSLFVRSQNVDWFRVGQDHFNKPEDPRDVLIPFRMNNVMIRTAEEKQKSLNMQRTALTLRYFLPFPVFTPALFLVFSSHPDHRRMDAINERIGEIDAIQSDAERDLCREEYNKLEKMREFERRFKIQFGENHAWSVTMNSTLVLDLYERILHILYHMELDQDPESRAQTKFEYHVKHEMNELDKSLVRISQAMIVRMKEEDGDGPIGQVIKRMSAADGPQRFKWRKQDAKAGVYQPYAEAFFSHMHRYTIGIIHIYEIALLNILGITDDLGNDNKRRKELMMCSRIIPDTSAQAGLCSDRLRRMVHEEQVQFLKTKTQYFGKPGFDLKACQHIRERYQFRRCLSPFAMLQMIEYLFTASKETAAAEEEEVEEETATSAQMNGGGGGGEEETQTMCVSGDEMDADELV